MHFARDENELKNGEKEKKKKKWTETFLNAPKLYIICMAKINYHTYTHPHTPTHTIVTIIVCAIIHQSCDNKLYKLKFWREEEKKRMCVPRAHTLHLISIHYICFEWERHRLKM